MEAPTQKRPNRDAGVSSSSFASLPPTPLEAMLGELSLPAIFGLYYARGSENYYGSKLTLGGADPALIASPAGEAALEWFGTVGVGSSGGGTSIYDDDGGPWEWSVNLVRLDVGGEDGRCVFVRGKISFVLSSEFISYRIVSYRLTTVSPIPSRLTPFRPIPSHPILSGALSCLPACMLVPTHALRPPPDPRRPSLREKPLHGGRATPGEITTTLFARS